MVTVSLIRRSVRRVLAGREAEAAPAGAVAAIERRLGRMLVLSRVGTAVFALLPFTIAARLDHVALVVASAVIALAFAVVLARSWWFGEQIRGSRLVLADVLVTLAVMWLGSRAASGPVRTQVMTELVPFCLACPAVVGFTLGARLVGVLITTGLAASWLLAALPVVSLKVGSDLLGFGLWYLIAVRIATELRRQAQQTEVAQAQRLAVLRQAAHDEKRQLAVQYREELQAVLHDQVLPILEFLRDGGHLTHAGRREAGDVARTARMLLDQRHARDEHPTDSLSRRIDTLVGEAAAHGLEVDPSIAVIAEPPPAVTAAAMSATREVLNNVRKHAGCPQARLYVEATDDDLQIVVTDRGVGMQPDTLPRAGGLERSTAAFRRIGGTLDIDPVPTGGSRVTLAWSAHREDPGGSP